MISVLMMMAVATLTFALVSAFMVFKLACPCAKEQATPTPITLVGEQVYYGTYPAQVPGMSEELGLYPTTRKRAP